MKKHIGGIFLFLTFFSSVFFAQNNLIEKLLNENKDLLGEVISKADSFEVQIIYTQINRDKNNFPSFTTYSYRVNPKNYFYPASMVKLPLAALSLEKLNDLGIKGLDKNSRMEIDSSYIKQTALSVDTSSPNGYPSIALLIKRVFLVSDNDAYNALYEFLGQKTINHTLHAKGYKDVKIIHRFIGGLSLDDNRKTNGLKFFDGDKVIYDQTPQVNDEEYKFDLNKLFKGIGYLDVNDKLINKPFDFTNKNYASLQVLTNILKAVIFPEAVPKKMRFNLTKDDYKFLYKYMSMFPRESEFPGYDTSYHDDYVKFLLFGGSLKNTNGKIRSFNKVGLAYGTLTDVAYIVDFENKVEFMLSATILVNKDGIFNDNKYDYQQIGLPFLANLGKVIYNYELKRPKKYLPDLSKFAFRYKPN
ncbi:MAG: class A beta-lactamase-related serine hydrolase [Bacteroidetes bacterium]|nr:class A beta-lactamase-related serine hydrolase [Bacteroidota bacterium]